MVSKNLQFILLLITTILSTRLQRRIILGDEVSPKYHYKFIVSIQVEGRHQFAGTIINPNTVLTVASKSTGLPSEYTVNVHRHNLVEASEDERGETIRVKKILKHPGFDSKTGENDISLWKLARSAVVDIGHIHLDVSGKLGKNIGLTAILAGWGATDHLISNPKNSEVLLETELDVTKGTECVNHYKYHGKILKSNSFICAINEIGSSVCGGDNGSPLFVRKDESFYLLGVATGADTCFLGVPPLFTRVSGIIEFINGHM